MFLPNFLSELDFVLYLCCFDSKIEEKEKRAREKPMHMHELKHEDRCFDQDSDLPTVPSF